MSANFWNLTKSNFKNNLLSGVIVVVPLVLTIEVLAWLIRFFDNLFLPFIRNYIPVYIPGLGFILSILFIYLVGVLTKNFVGRKVVAAGEALLNRIPVAKTVYSAVKQIMITLTDRSEKVSQKVVLIEYPRKGILSVGLYNGEIRIAGKEQKYASILVVTAINPASGFLVLVPSSELIFTSLSLEQAMKMIVSGGMVSPESIPLKKP